MQPWLNKPWKRCVDGGAFALAESCADITFRSVKESLDWMVQFRYDRRRRLPLLRRWRKLPGQPIRQGLLPLKCDLHFPTLPGNGGGKRVHPGDASECRLHAFIHDDFPRRGGDAAAEDPAIACDLDPDHGDQFAALERRSRLIPLSIEPVVQHVGVGRQRTRGARASGSGATGDSIGSTGGSRVRSRTVSRG